VEVAGVQGETGRNKGGRKKNDGGMTLRLGRGEGQSWVLGRV